MCYEGSFWYVISLEHIEDNGIYFGDFSAAMAAAAMAVGAAASQYHPTSNAHNSAKNCLILIVFSLKCYI